MERGNGTVELGCVCNIELGKRIAQKKDAGSLYPVYGGGEIRFLTDKFNREDCLVIARFAMPFQCTRYIEGKFFLTDNGFTLRSKMDGLSQDYLNWHILALNDEIYSLGKGTVQRTLDMDAFKQIKLRMPSASEQTQIVEELYLIKSVIEKRRCQLKELDNLSSSTFHEMFGEVGSYKMSSFAKLYSLCDVIARGGISSYSTDDYVDSPEKGVLSLNTASIVDNELNFENCPYISFEKYQKTKITVEEGDVILVKKSTYFEQYARVKSLPHLATINQQLILLKNISINPTYLIHYLRTPYAKCKYQESVTGTSGSVFSHSKLRMLPVYVPPVEQQDKFAERVEKIEHTKQLIKKSIKELESLLKSRMNYHFT